MIKNFSIDDLLMGAEFFEVVRECYKLKYSNIIFSEFFMDNAFYVPSIIYGIKNESSKG